ncbi:MAG TPA: RNA methyltransferase [Candidatus Sulfotelmatobacter sp.]|nr:RNA methyltransferase [Candidatus Sulfotelmatobacter sp.]
MTTAYDAFTPPMNRSSESTPGARDRLRRIEGRHNPLLKQLRQAFSRAELSEHGDCAIEGVHIVEEAIRSGLRFQAVVFRESAQSLAERLLPQIGSHVQTLSVPDKLFDNAVPSENPQGVAALVHLKEYSVDDLLERVSLGPIVAVAGLQDPGNLGTILRSAEAFGGAGIVCGEGTVSRFNSKVIRASAGSIFRLPQVTASDFGGLDAVCSKLRSVNVRLVGTSSHKGAPLDQARLTEPLAIFVGGEGAGLPKPLMAQMDELIAIPHSPRVESLNAGIAASILLYEAARQRRGLSTV